MGFLGGAKPTRVASSDWQDCVQLLFLYCLAVFPNSHQRERSHWFSEGRLVVWLGHFDLPKMIYMSFLGREDPAMLQMRPRTAQHCWSPIWNQCRGHAFCLLDEPWSVWSFCCLFVAEFPCGACCEWFPFAACSTDHWGHSWYSLLLHASEHAKHKK